VKANQNEAPWDWPEALKEEALREAMAIPFNRYPPFEEVRLASALGGRWGLPPESVLVANGSNELLQALFTAALGPGRRLLMPRPSFGLYRQLALLCRCDAHEQALEEGLRYGSETWLASVKRHAPHVVLLCSPNNPTGACFPDEALEVLLDVAPGLVAVDEAYGEFGGRSAARYLPSSENLVVLRTFSKAWSGAALRLGYALAAPSAAAQIRKALLPYTLSPLTAALGLAALRNTELFEARVARVVQERERLREALADLPGLAVFPSEANFLLVRLGGVPARDAYEGLKARGVLVRDVSGMHALSGCLRISVGEPEQNARVVRALAEVLQ
jgi:histidinol-phosphate aminotransferase